MDTPDPDRTPPGLTLVLDAVDTALIARFWAAALRYDLQDPVDVYQVLTPPQSGPVLLVQRVGAPKSGKNRMHLDLHVSDADAECTRLERLGGSRIGTGALGDVRWVTMADPEGNEFDVVQDPPD
ncbi:VOC family protein [Nakamurella sp. YIM 132087]|uniref:VOC family protein n=1 Tax=Nakamurella alba TaxID=2665158 RepID=A0A7K1FMS4_9ACTN|nr:VOC family protein [Nakamurella alba]MTD15471.1 VOC family protein [Nakamurella alba]